MEGTSGALYKLNAYHGGEKNNKPNQQTNPTTAQILAAFERDGILH